MVAKFNFSFSEADKSREFSLDLPSKCPHCGVALKELPVQGYGVKKNDSLYTLFSIYHCPHCDDGFMAVHYSGNQRYDTTPAQLVMVFPADRSSSVTKFSPYIETLSPDFVTIFNQSELAERDHLDKICGMGYRKALEFLIKDYAISTHPSDTEDIKKSMLGACINKYIDNDQIKTLASRSAWIGNDETHYVRRYDELGISEMKKFINACVYFILMNQTAAEAAAIQKK